jgi:hypothetical protein
MKAILPDGTQLDGTPEEMEKFVPTLKCACLTQAERDARFAKIGSNEWIPPPPHCPVHDQPIAFANGREWFGRGVYPVAPIDLQWFGGPAIGVPAMPTGTWIGDLPAPTCQCPKIDPENPDAFVMWGGICPLHSPRMAKGITSMIAAGG